MSFFAICTGSWRIPAQDFMHQLRARWPGVAIREVKDSDLSDLLTFELTTKHSWVDGALQSPGKSIYFDSNLRDAAQLALWFRSLAPSFEPMVFCDESMSGYLELSPDTTEADIFQAFGYEPPPPGWMNYTILPRGGWGIPVHLLLQHVRSRWPAARVVESEDSDKQWAYRFQVPMACSEVRGKVRRNIDSMVLTGDLRDCAEFSLGLRALIPTEEVFLMCDQGNVDLQVGMKADDVLRTLGTRP